VSEIAIFHQPSGVHPLIADRVVTMRALLRLLRIAAFVVIAPVLAIVMVFIFIIPHNLDLWFSSKRRKEATAVWIKLWSWAQGSPIEPKAQ
jgi:hypothetical protein